MFISLFFTMSPNSEKRRMGYGRKDEIKVLQDISTGD